jgi:hypothetical protein
MRRLLTIAALLLLVAASMWLYRWFSVSPDARTARPYAQKFARELQSDVRFTDVQVRVLELGSKGPVYIHGCVRSDVEAAELRRRFDALGCPVGVSWQVAVVTNQSGDTK